MLLGAALCLGIAAGLRRDLDVGVPPGSPLRWTDAFPVSTPDRRPLFSPTPEKGTRGEAAGEDERSSVGRTRPEIEVAATTSFGLVRILTWDIPAHLDFVRPKEPKPLTGALAVLPRPPQYGDGLYWVTLAPLLRLLLHPELAPRADTLAHLIEIGEPTLTVLDTASTEPALHSVARELAKRIQIEESTDAVPNAPLAARDANDAVEGMLLRFVHDELTAAYPYDPEGAFAWRLLLFPTDVEPYLIRYAREGGVLLRRAAAVALGRLRTEAALAVLIERAAATSDDVELVRALAGIARFRGELDFTPLLDRLAGTRDDVQRRALLGALANPTAVAALPDLVDLGKRALRSDDSEVLMGVLMAIAEIHLRTHRDEVAALLDDVARAARQNPRQFRAKRRHGNMSADVPDSPRTRGEILAQLVDCVRLRLDATDPAQRAELQRLLLHAAQPSPRGSPGFGRIHPPVQYVFVDTLGRAAGGGEELLRRIAAGEGGSGPLRARALANLPYDTRAKLALAFFDHISPRERLLGFETLIADRHARAPELARKLLAEAAIADPERATAVRRHLFLRAVRLLSTRGELTAEDLRPLLHHVANVRTNQADRVAELRDEIRALVEDAAQVFDAFKIRKRITAMIDYVMRHGLNPGLREEARAEIEDYLNAHVKGLRARRGDVGFKEMVIEAITKELLGWRMPAVNRDRAEFVPPVALAEEILLALGRMRTSAAVELLAEVLGERNNHHRAIACLALAVADAKEHAPTVASFLLDDDPFVRYCAYRSMKHLTEHDVPIDWMYAPTMERFPAAELYFQRAHELAATPASKEKDR